MISRFHSHSRSSTLHVVLSATLFYLITLSECAGSVKDRLCLLCGEAGWYVYIPFSNTLFLFYCLLVECLEVPEEIRFLVLKVFLLSVESICLFFWCKCYWVIIWIFLWFILVNYYHLNYWSLNFLLFQIIVHDLLLFGFISHTNYCRINFIFGKIFSLIIIVITINFII